MAGVFVREERREKKKKTGDIYVLGYEYRNSGRREGSLGVGDVSFNKKLRGAG